MSEFTVGRFRVRVAYRHVSTDEGVTLHVFGPTDAGEEEVLRFDCFKNQPHYHLGWSYRSEPFIPIESADPLAWAIEQLRSQPNELLSAAGALPFDDQELTELSHELENIREAGLAAASASASNT